MYDINVRKLALRMVRNVGMLRTSAITNISRTTLWRWKRFGVDQKRRAFESKLFQENKDLLKSFLLSTQCTTARGVVAFFREVHSVRLSSKSVYKFIKRLGFSRKRTRLRGQCKGDLGALIKAFCAKYTSAVGAGKTLVSVDECGFSERIKPIYGYSPVGQPVIVKTSGGWVHHSLLMAVFSDSRKAFVVKKGSICKSDFAAFIDSLGLDERSMVVLDNASIHKNLQLKSTPGLCYTPPYSPEFNAIELCFAKVKRCFRRRNAGMRIDVCGLIASSVDDLSAHDIEACFGHVLSSFVLKQA